MIEFRRAQTEDEMAAMYRLRYEVYCIEKRFLNADDYPDQLEHDEWDKYSVHFIAKDKNDIVGTVRLIKDSPIGLPTEKYFRLKRPEASLETFAEVSRFIVHPQLRKLTFQIISGLYKVMFDYSREEGRGGRICLDNLKQFLSDKLTPVYTAINSFGSVLK